MITMRLLPNAGEREGAPSTILLVDSKDTVDELLRLWENGAGAHYIVDKFGEIWQLVENEDMALDCPDTSIAIAITETGDENSDAQIGTLISLVTALSHEYKIPMNKITGSENTIFPWFDFLNVVGARVCELELNRQEA